MLPLYVVYRNPSDLPHTYVIRRHWTDLEGPRIETEPWATAEDEAGLEALRLDLQAMGLVRFTPSRNDDPVILEVWL